MTTTDVTLASNGTWTTVATTTTTIITNNTGFQARYRFGTSTSIGHVLEAGDNLVVTENVALLPMQTSSNTYIITVSK